MQTVTFELQTTIANKIERYFQLFGNKEAMFDKFIAYQIQSIKREIASMQSDLSVYEQKHGLNSQAFYELFEQGKLGDSKEFILWSGIYEMQQSCKQKLSLLL